MSLVTVSLLNDTGRSGDGVTFDARLVGTAQANSTVELLAGATVLAEVTTDADGRFDYSPILSDGLHSLTVRQAVGDGTYSTAQLAIQIDTVAPTLTFFRLNDGANADLPTDAQSGLPLINSQVLQGSLFLNVLSQGVETTGTTHLTGHVTFSSDAFAIDQMVFAANPAVHAFPNNPVGDGVMTSVIRAGSALSTLFQQYVPSGTYTVHVNVSDLAGNVAAELTRSVVVDTHADEDGAATLLLDGGGSHVIVRPSATAVGFIVSELDSDASAVARFTDGTHTQSVAVNANGHYTVDLSSFTGLVSSSLAISDVHGNTAGVVGNKTTLISGVSSDFDGNGSADIVARHDGGAFSVWHSFAGTFSQNDYMSTSVTNAWHIVSTDDFSGDGKADVLWRHDGGAFSVWQADNTGFTSNTYLNTSVGLDWKIAGTGDFDGDGKADIMWRHNGGALSEWQSTGGSFAANTYFDGTVSQDWHVQAVADFNGDGKADLLWRHANGAISEWQSTGTQFAKNVVSDGSVGTDWHVAGTGDFNGDGKADILWRHDSGTFSEWQSNGDGFTKNVVYDASVGNDWQIAQISDFNGDGKADLLWRNAGAHALSIWQSTGDSFTPNTYFNASFDADLTIQAPHYDVV